VNAGTWARAKALFEQAMELPASERRAWLDRAGADADIAALVQTLIESTDTLDGFLESPPLVQPEDIAADDGWLRPGARIGDYSIVRKIAEGGMGVVYLARETSLGGRDVALKALPPATSADPVLRARLKLEAEAMGKINHPAVATVYAFKEIDGQIFIASEYVDGRSLRELIKEGPLPQERAVELALEIADALNEAHAAGVVHRDLKPDNVLLTKRGGVKVVDFGIARVISHGGPDLTVPGYAIGTPAYMAPEQFLGGPVDARADLYSLGVVLTEMLTGRRRSEDGVPSLPARIAPIVRRCLQHDPAARFASAATFREALLTQRKGESRDRWWWRFHQAATIVAYALLLMPAWLVRRAVSGPTIGGLAGRWLFVVVLAAGIVAITLRLHLLFVSRAGARAVEQQRRLSASSLRAADLAFAAGLVVSGLFVENLQAPLAVLLIGAGAAAGVSALVIEPATLRAAFDEETTVEGSTSR